MRSDLKAPRRCRPTTRRDGYVAGNLVYDISDNDNPAYPPEDNSADGIYMDGATRVTIERNVLHHNNISAELASEHTGRTTSFITLRNNLIYLSNGPGLSIGGQHAVHQVRRGQRDLPGLRGTAMHGRDAVRLLRQHRPLLDSEQYAVPQRQPPDRERRTAGAIFPRQRVEQHRRQQCLFSQQLGRPDLRSIHQAGRETRLQPVLRA